MLLSTAIKTNLQEQMEFKTLYPLGPFLTEKNSIASFSSAKDLVHFLAILAGRWYVWDWLVFGQEWRSIAQTYISYISFTSLGHTGNYLLGGSKDFGLERFYSCCTLALWQKRKGGHVWCQPVMSHIQMSFCQSVL